MSNLNKIGYKGVSTELEDGISSCYLFSQKHKMDNAKILIVAPGWLGRLND